MILVPYDGSTDAQAAVERAAALMPGAHAVIVTVWASRDGAPVCGAVTDAQPIDELTATSTSRDGARRANGAGLVARAVAVPSRGDIADAILGAAAESGADPIVMGTCGWGDGAPLVLGSVARAVVQRADCAVMLVPSVVTVERRLEDLHLVVASSYASSVLALTAAS